MPFTPAAYAGLTPNDILDALDAVGFRPDGRVLQLNSYENRVHQVFLEDGEAVVTKFYRPGRWSDAQILEEHAFALELAEAEVPVVAPLILPPATPGDAVQRLGTPATLAVLQRADVRHRLSVSPRRAGREPDLEDRDTLQRLGYFIGRLHEVGRRRPFRHRRRIDLLADAHAAIATVRALPHLGGDTHPTWPAAADQAVQAMRHALDRCPPWQPLRLHGDCHLGNVLWREGRPHMVDLDDACTGPAVQDLWMLAATEDSNRAGQLGELLQGYEQFCSFDRHELGLIEPLRTLRMLRHSAWLAERWDDPAFPAAFPEFGSPAYWSQQATQLREQVEFMSDDG